MWTKGPSSTSGHIVDRFLILLQILHIGVNVQVSLFTHSFTHVLFVSLMTPILTEVIEKKDRIGRGGKGGGSEKT